MSDVRNVLDVIERMAPQRYALPTDRSGFQVGDPTAEVTRGLVSMDRSLAAIDYARAIGAQVLVTHHPLLFSPPRTIDASQYDGRAVHELIRAGIACIAAHTNWDAATGGINDELARRLDLDDVKPFGISSEVASFKLVFFCPADVVDRVIDAVSAAGGGQIGSYRRCAFSSDGVGTFIGDEATHPAIGRPGIRQSVLEKRVEMVVPSSDLPEVVKALIQAHPYEEPAYDLVPLRPKSEMPLARVGNLPKAITLGEFVAEVDRRLGTRSLTWGDPAKPIRRVAVCGGAADDEWQRAKAEGADVLVTGEAKQHHALEASESGIGLVSAGHYATEHPGCEALRDRLADEIPDIEWSVFVPAPGFAGRPFSVS